MQKRMTKLAINKASDQLVDKYLSDEVAVTFHELYVRADQLYFDTAVDVADGLSDEYKVLKATIDKLEALHSTYRAKITKLYADMEAIQKSHVEAGNGWLYLQDSCVAAENMDSRFGEGSVGYMMHLYNSECIVIACHAESEGLDINAMLGYVIY